MMVPPAARRDGAAPGPQEFVIPSAGAEAGVMQ